MERSIGGDKEGYEVCQDQLWENGVVSNRQCGEDLPGNWDLGTAM